MHPTTAEPPHSLRPGHFRWRALAAATDFIILFGGTLAYTRYFGVETDEGYQVEGCGHVLILLAFYLVWLPLPEALVGQTLGKRFAGLRVVNLTGGSVGFSQSVVRHLFDVVDLFFFGLVGYVVAKSNPLHQRVGDLVAKTRVITVD